MTNSTTENGTEARLTTVLEHVRQENRHDLDGILATFGPDPSYDDEAWGDHHRGRTDVQSYYEDLLTALPDLHVDVLDRHVTDEHVILEVQISGTHEGPWRGLPGTGRRVSFPLCAIYSFDEENRLVAERIFYDRSTVLRQVGLFHDPSTLPGRVLTALSHPFTVLRSIRRALTA